MKIALDMQSRQTAGSRDRGIGRYSLSLAKAMLEKGRGHEFSILLNGVFDNTVNKVKADFEIEEGDPRIRVYQTLEKSTEWVMEDAWRHRASEYLREAFIASGRFDFVHCTSLFESPMDESSTSWGQWETNAAHGVTLYDLIPYAYSDVYLNDPPMRTSYLRKVQVLRKADLLLAISAFSREEAIRLLGIDPDRVVNIGAAADKRFQPKELHLIDRAKLLARYNLDKFIMYTGGIDHRKNIERLIQAYARLPDELIARYQLVIVCSVQAYQREAMLKLASQHGLASGRLVMTGYVSDDDLVDFYNLCDLFVFPSWCEGFGLPALEAMQCGAPVIAAGTSSLPEVVGLPDALFDPYSIDAIAAKMTHALQDDGFRTHLREHGKSKSKSFTWEASASSALEAMERTLERKADHKGLHSICQHGQSRPKLAFVSPLPPGKSGISGYSAQLVPFLDKHYEITLICKTGETSNDYLQANFKIHTPDWLLANADQFDRVVYQFGNSDHHDYMFSLLEAVPGTVVLHDFWLSNLLEYVQVYRGMDGLWDEHLHYSHGWAALSRRRGEADDIPIVVEFPCNRLVIDSSVGLILHAQSSVDLLSTWYGDDRLTDVRLINSLKPVASQVDKPSAKAKLGIANGDLLICSFGFIHSSKHSLRLAQVFMASALYSTGRASLVLVGQNADGDYGKEVERLVSRSEGRIRFTGFVSDPDYSLYLQAADVAVQLRATTRGETSAAALDCLANGVALLVNDNNAFSQIPEGAVVRIDKEFKDADLLKGIEELADDAGDRSNLVAAGYAFLRRECDPATIAGKYRDAIEEFHWGSAVAQRNRVIDRIAAINADVGASPHDVEAASVAAMANFPLSGPQKHLYLDEALLSRSDADTEAWLKDRLRHPGGSVRLEVLRVGSGEYVNAMDTVRGILEVGAISLGPLGIDLHSGDVCIIGGVNPSLPSGSLPDSGLEKLLRDVTSSGARLWCWWPEFNDDLLEQGFEVVSTYLTKILPHIDGILVDSQGSAESVKDHALLLGLHGNGRWPRAYYPAGPAPTGLPDIVGSVQTGDFPGWSRVAIEDGSYRGWSAGQPVLISDVGEYRDGFTRTMGKEGCLVYGPYTSLPAGRHILRILGSVHAAADVDPARWDMIADKGAKVLGAGTIDGRSGCLAQVEVRLDSPEKDVEIRIWTNSSTQMLFLGYQISSFSP